MSRLAKKHLCAALLLSLLTACQGQPQPPAQPQPAAPHPAARAAPHARHRLTDRGIGGTGAPQTAPTPTADRGIGGTGILGIITGFGSVLVDGIEIRYDNDAPVDIDGNAATAADLRTGQLVAIQAEGPDTALRATKIAVQTAVAGRIEPPQPGSSILTVSGQPVSVPPEASGAETFTPGDWVRVSGLRRNDGVIVATRLDAAPAGTLLVRGPVSRDADVTRVGTLVLPDPAAASLQPGQFVIVSGDQASGLPHVTGVAPDPLFADPAAWFGTANDTLILQAFLHVQNGTISVNGLTVAARSTLAVGDLHDGIAVISLRREPDGSYTADSVRYTDDPGQHSDGANGPGQGDHFEVPREDEHAPYQTSDRVEPNL
jgi:hypothetical protein